jgi:hypothetical protein
VVAGTVFAITVGAALLGAVLRLRLPKHHLSDESRDVMKLVMGLVATMAALVLGLLIASSKNFYDTQTAELQTLSVNIIKLDGLLAEYGPEARPLRDALRVGVVRGYRRIWPENGGPAVSIGEQPASQFHSLTRMFRSLSPQTDAQRALQAKAGEIASSIGEARLLMLEQVDNALNWPFLLILVFWIAVLFLGFGLFAPPNATAMVALVVGGLSAASAIFMILEMSMPYDGLVRISPAPLLAALSLIGR